MEVILALLALLAMLAALLLAAYLKGKKDERAGTLAESVDALVDSKLKQEAREVSHANVIRRIADGPINTDDASRMLSEWPDDDPSP